MNRILFHADERDGPAVALRDRRARHIREVLHARVGDALKVGEIDGLTGTGRVESVTGLEVRLTVTLDREPPPPRIDLLLALPRPKVLKRLWAQLAALGVGRIILVNAARVERCYFDTHWLEPGHYTPLLIEGLEQAGTTHLPEVRIRRGFKPCIEDELPGDYADALKFLAHPGEETTSLEALAKPSVCASEGFRVQGSGGLNADSRPAAHRPLLAVGPEGGWTEYELAQFDACGFLRLSMGPRILRTDTACIALLGRLSG